MRKKVVAVLFMALSMMIVFSSLAFATEDKIRVQLNGEFIDFVDENKNEVNPQIINDRTMVPMRKIFEEFGMEVEWNAEERSVIAKNNEKIISLIIGNKKATVGTNVEGMDGLAMVELDSEPVIVDGRTLVPVRFIAESLNKKVDWDAKNRAVIIIDYAFVEEMIKEKAPNLYKYLSEELVTIETSKTNTKINGKLNYTDSKDRKNNGTVTLKGTVEAKKNLEAIGIDIDMELDGTGSLKETVESIGVGDIEYEIILDLIGKKLYQKSELLLGNDDWNETELTEEIITVINQYLNIANNTSGMVQVNEALKMEGAVVDINTFDALKTSVEVICELMSDKHFNVSGTSTKTYTFEINLMDIIDIASKYSTEPISEEAKEMLEQINPTLKEKITMKNGVCTKTVITLSSDIKSEETNEKISILLEVISTLESYNKKITVSIPD